MKLIQLNTWGGALGRHLQRFLKNQNADIWMLQEVVSSPEGVTSYFDFLQDAEESTQLPHSFFSPMSDYRFGKKKVFYGNAILARLSFHKTYHEFTHLGYQPDFDFETDDYNARLFQHAVLNVDGKALHLVNYHGYHDPHGKEGNEETAKHCARIAAYMEQLDGPKILTGDFNLAPHSKSLQPLNDAYRNLVIDYNIETTRNEFARSMTPVDFIWVSGDVTVNDFHVAPDLISDHAALVLDFTL